MNRTVILILLMVLALMGLADSWYLAQSAATDTALSCDIGAGLDGCNIVAQSPYSKLFGIPLALYGVGFYALFFVLAAVALMIPTRMIYRGLFLLGIVGAILSLIFLVIQFALIKAVCIYCIASAAIAFVMWYLTRMLWKRFAPPQLVSVP